MTTIKKALGRPEEKEEVPKTIAETKKQALAPKPVKKAHEAKPKPAHTAKHSKR